VENTVMTREPNESSGRVCLTELLGIDGVATCVLSTPSHKHGNRRRVDWGDVKKGVGKRKCERTYRFWPYKSRLPGEERVDDLSEPPNIRPKRRKELMAVVDGRGRTSSSSENRVGGILTRWVAPRHGAIPISTRGGLTRR